MARTITAAERYNVGALRHAAFAKFEITDPDGTWRDVTTSLRAKDFFNQASITEDIDNNTAQLTAELLREASTLSLSPFRSDSLLNRNLAGSYAPILDLWRKWRASVAIMPAGYAPGTTDYKELAAGRIDRIEVGGKDSKATLTGRGEEAVLINRWIDTERTYGSGAGVAMETVLQSMLDDNLGSGVVTLYTPVSPSYLMKTWTQPKDSLMNAMAAVAEKAGFVLRYRYDASNVNRLTLFKPNRVATVEDWSLGPSEYTALSMAGIDLSGVRNFAKLTYADATLGKQVVYSPKNTGTISCTAGAATFSVSQAGVIANGARVVVHGLSGSYIVSAFNGTTGCTLSGSPTFAASNWGTSASLTRYDRIDIEIDLSAESQVTDAASAQAFDDAVRQDLEFPNLTQQFETLGFWFAQLHDYGKFLANGVQYDQDQFGGVTQLVHRIANATVVSTIGARGKPAGRYTSWKGLASSTVPGGTGTQSAIQLLCRAKVQSTSATQVVFRVAVADPFPLGDISIAYVGAGVGTISPASPRTIVRANVTKDIDTTGTVDITVDRAAFGTGTGRITFTASSAGRVSSTDAGDVPALDRDTVKLGLRARVTATTPTTLTVRVAVADPYPQGAGSGTITYQDLGSGGVSPGSGGTVTPAATLTEAAGTFIDYTITRPAFGAGAGRVTFTGTAANRTSDSDAVDVPEADRDTQSLSMRILRVSETATDIVVRVEVISPNAGTTVTVAYDAGGLTVSPSSGGTLTSTTNFGTTAHIDYTITRDVPGGTPRRVAFTVSASGFIDATDGVDVPAKSDRFRCKAILTGSAQSITSGAAPVAVNWNGEDYDNGSLHDNVTNNNRITIPTGGDKGVWFFNVQVNWSANATGVREVTLKKNNTTVKGYASGPGVNSSGIGPTSTISTYDDAPAVGDYYEVLVYQDSGVLLSVNTQSSFFSATHQA